jgi:hypothetical protein
MRSNRSIIFILGLMIVVVLSLLIYTGLTWLSDTIRQSTDRAVAPVEQVNRDLRTQSAQVNSDLQTQVAQVLHPTPTILPDPITIIHEMRSLARLETIQYTIEKVITAETGQGSLGFLFGDRLLLVAHGKVIAGTDMSKIGGQDITRDGLVLKMRLPEPEIFIAALDNEKTYIFDRSTSVLTKGDPRLETMARQAAESEILNAAIKDGILNQAKINTENYLVRMLRHLGFPEVVFVYGPAPTPTPTAAPK